MHKHATMNRYYRLVWSHVHACWVAVAEGARGHGKGGARRRKATLLAALAAAGLAGAGTGAASAAPPLPTALPTGGQVVAGQAQISTSGSQMTVSQATSQAILNWGSFDIGAQASVRFNQPSASAVALNRVQSANPSQIYGKLDANGQVFLVNPNGVLFAPGAQVNVGGLVASSLGLADRDFLARDYNFAGEGGGAVRNEGSIAAAAGGAGGYVALLGPSVANSGSISAPQGSVALAAGQQIGVDLRGDGLITVRTNRGALNALAENQGLIQAAGGQVLLSAGAADALARASVNNAGLIQAGGLSTKGGSIRLVAEGGDVQAGRLDASSQDARGGSVAISGKGVSLGGTVSVDGAQGGSVSVTAAGALASGGAVTAQGTAGNGGSISYRAGGSLTETSGASANASGTLGGGAIAVQGDGSLLTSGSYSARGGAANGGRIDLSGGTVTLLSAKVDASGEQQGGLVRVGGAFQGGAAQDGGADPRFVKRWGQTAAIASADRTFINDSSAIDVSARGAAGNGGTAVVWSERQTTVLGTLNARGGAGGSGGAVEVSSHGDLRYVGLDGINAGAGGALLLDPKNLVIGDFNYAYAWSAQAILGSGYSGSNGGGNNAGGGLQVGGASFGSAVAMSADGTVLAVGVPMDGSAVNGNTPDAPVYSAGAGTARGSVRLFGFSDGSFSGATLRSNIGSGYSGMPDYNLALADGALFGSSVALNAAGTKLAVGAVGENNGAGSVRLFDLAAGTSKPALTSTINAGAGGSSGTSNALQFGTSVALNGDGTRLAVGAVNDSGGNGNCSSCGAVYLFTNGALSTTLGADYSSGFSAGAGAQFGSAVALNGNGTKLAVGAVGVNDLKGAVYTFNWGSSSASLSATYSSTASSNSTDLNVNLSSGELFGSSLSFNDSGSRLAVGSPSTGGVADAGLGPGSVRLIEIGNGPVLKAVLRRGLRLPDGTFHTTPDYSGFGYAVALNGAGTRLVVGAPYANSANGSVEGTGAVHAYMLTTADFRDVDYTDATGLNVGIDASALAQQLFNGTSVSLRASNDLLVNANVLVGSGSGTRGNLTLEAGRSITVNSNISTSGGNLALLANSASASVSTTDRDNGNAGITVASGYTLDSGSGQTSLTIGAGARAGDDASGDIQVDGTVRGARISLINSGKTAESDVRVGSTGRLVGTATTGTSVLVAAGGAGSGASANGSFVSAAGTNTISAAAGSRYMVYSDAPTSTAEGMTGYSKHYNQAYTGADLAYAGSGSWFLYKFAPVLTVTPNSGVTKVYDGLAMGTIGYATPTGLIDGDANGALSGTLSGSDSKNVGSYSVQLGSLASALGYTISLAPRTYSITPRTLIATVSGNNKVYDGLTGATVRFGDSRVSGDVLTLSGNASFASKGVGNGKSISVSGISLSGTDAANYTLFNPTATASGNITPRTLHATAGNVSKVYDGLTGVTSMSGVLGDDRVAGDLLTLTGSGNFEDKNAGSGKTVNYAGIAIAAGGDAANYVLDSATVSGTGAITQRSLTATASGVSKVYDGLTAATATLGDNRVNGDVLMLSSTGASYADKNAGNGKTISVDGISLSGADAANYTLANTSATGSGNITRRTLTASATGVDKVYDGLVAAAVTLGDDRVAGDVLTAAGAAAFSDKHAGAGKTVTVSGIALSGADAGNYTLAAPTASTTAAITQRTLTASAVGVDKVYDGLATATASLADNRVGGDALTVTGASASFADKNAGAGKTVSIEGITLGGADAGNYVLASATATGTASITKRALTASATGIDKVYDGLTGATATLGDDRLTGDVLTLNGSAAFADKNVGSGKAVTVTGIALSGADAGNYVLAAGTAGTTAAITPRTLTASATGIGKVYDGLTAAAVTLGSDAVAGDVLSLSSTGAAFADKNVGSGKTVTVTGIALGGADAGNYTLASTTASTSAAISQRVLNASATAGGKVYDGLTAASATLGDDRVAGDALTLASTGASFADKNAGTGKTVTVNGITVSGTDAANYTLASGTATATADISKRTLTASTGTVDKVYDGLAAATISLGDDRVAGDVLTTSGSAVYSDKNVGTGKTVTVTGIALSGADAGNYTLASTSANSTGSITARTLNATTVGGGKVYDGLASSSAVLADDRVAGDALTLTGGSASFADKNAGTGKAVTIGGLALSGADAGNYVLASSSATGSADITARVLTASAAAANKVYDGGVLAGVSFSDNRLSGDQLSITGNAAFADKNAGSAKAVSVTGLALSGADAGNYTLASGTVSSSAAITALQLSVGASAGNKVYDGSTAASATLSDNRLAGDVLSLSSSGAAFANKNAGSGKTVTVSGIALSGADAANYTLASTSATASADITQRVLNASATAANKVYDGLTTASATLGDDRVSGDVLVLSSTGAAFADKNAGSAKAVTVSGIAVSGADAANYTLAATTASASADIGKRVLNAAASGVSKVYDGLLTGTASLGSDAIAGDALDITGTAAFTDKNVGNGKTLNVSGIAVSGADAGNYTLASNSLATTGAITRRTLTATATGSTKVYDGNLSAAVTLADNRIAGDDLALAGTGSYADKNAGAGKAVTVAGITLSGADAGNYAIAPAAVQTTGTITARTLNATATGQNKVYDGSVAATVAYASDALAGDTVTLAGQAAFADKNAGNGKAVSVTGLTLAGADAGNYVLGATTASTTASIAQRALNVGASAGSKVYDGTASASISLSDDRVAGDQLALSSGGASFADKNAGSGKAVTVTGVALSGADAGNYRLASTTASGTGTITQRTLTASATAGSKVYDGTTAATATLSDDRISGDSLSVAGGAANFADKNAGSGKAVTVSGIALSGADAGNYVLASSTASATGAITQRALNASAANVTKVYDGSTSATVVLGDDRIAGDALQVSGQGSFSDANAGSGKTVNITGLALSGADAANYTFSGGSATGSGTITQRALQASIAGSTVKTYDGTANAVLTPGSLLLSGFVAGQGATLQSGSAGRYNDANVAGANTVTASLSASDFSAGQGTLLSNYLLPTVASGAGAITARAVTVTGVQAATKVYDGTTAATLSSRGTLAGLVAGESLTLNGPATGVFDSRSAGAGKTVTASGYSLADGGAGNNGRASNYALASTTASGTGTISQATLTVVVDDKSRVQGTQNPAFTSSVSGLVGGDTRDVLGSLTLATSATAQSAAGQYAITASGGAAPNDYRVFFLDGVLTVTAAGVQPGQFDPVAAIVSGIGSVAGGDSAPGFGGNAGGFGAASGSGNPQALLAEARGENGNPGGNASNDGSGNAGADNANPAAPANGVTFVNGNSKIVSRNGGVRNLE